MTIQIVVTQCICVAFAIYISRTQSTKHVYIATFCANLAYMLMYLANSDLATMVSCGFITVRSFVYIFKPRIKNIRILSYILPWFMVAVQISIGLIFIKSPWQILPIIGGSWTCIFMWFFDTTQLLRIGNATCNSIWLVYDIHGSLFIVVIGRIIMIATNVIAYIQHIRDGNNSRTIEIERSDNENNTPAEGNGIHSKNEQ